MYCMHCGKKNEDDASICPVILNKIQWNKMIPEFFVYFDIKDPKIARAAGIGAWISWIPWALAFLILRILWIWFFWQTLFSFKKNEVFFLCKNSIFLYVKNIFFLKSHICNVVKIRKEKNICLLWMQKRQKLLIWVM